MSRAENYPTPIRDLVFHGGRLACLLKDLEEKKSSSISMRGQATQLKAVVNGTVNDFRNGVCDLQKACAAISSYLDDLHRKVARRLGATDRLACCTDHDAVTADGSGLNAPPPC